LVFDHIVDGDIQSRSLGRQLLQELAGPLALLRVWPDEQLDRHTIARRRPAPLGRRRVGG
jgi:hypothetical protein